INKWCKGYFGVGLSAFRDVVGTTNFGSTKINLSLSSVLFMDDKNSASVGLMGSWGQNSMSPDNLQWDSQFNGQSFDASLASNELFTFENSNYFDFSAGAFGLMVKVLKHLVLKMNLIFNPVLLFTMLLVPTGKWSLVR